MKSGSFDHPLLRLYLGSHSALMAPPKSCVILKAPTGSYCGGWHELPDMGYKMFPETTYKSWPQGTRTSLWIRWCSSNYYIHEETNLGIKSFPNHPKPISPLCSQVKTLARIARTLSRHTKHFVHSDAICGIFPIGVMCPLYASNDLFSDNLKTWSLIERHGSAFCINEVVDKNLDHTSGNPS